MSDLGLALAESVPQDFMAFRVLDQEYCVEIGAVREVRRRTPMARLPHVPEHVRGVINLRGVILPVVCARARLGLRAPATEESEIEMILEVGGKLLGLLVDEVLDIVTAPEDGVATAAGLEEEGAGELIRSVVTLGGRVLGILSIDHLLPETHGPAR